MAPLDGTAFQIKPRLVIVHKGDRGPRGLPGPAGGPGPKGDSFNLRGSWVHGTTYCPLDAVSGRSSALPGVRSLYIQRSAVACAPSTVAPHLDLNRWEEIGAVDVRNAFGGIWQVFQIAHGFTRIGQPVAYSLTADRYVLADARRRNETAIGVVRAVVDANTVILQSTGEVPAIDPAVILGGGGWVPGTIYYATTVPGYLAPEAPEDPSYYSNPILLAAHDVPSTGRSGIVLPWAPVGDVANRTARQLVGHDRFYYTIVAPTLSVSGSDDFDNELAYEVGDEIEVFLNGLNLREVSAYTATDGATITFAASLDPGDEVEVWVPSQSTVPVLQAYALKVDNIEEQFDGSQQRFALQIGGVQVALQNTLNLRLWIDGSSQEPLIDYVVEEDPGAPGLSSIVLTQPPDFGMRFWGILLQEVAPPTEPLTEEDVIEIFNGLGPFPVVPTGMVAAWVPDDNSLVEGDRPQFFLQERLSNGDLVFGIADNDLGPYPTGEDFAVVGFLEAEPANQVLIPASEFGSGSGLTDGDKGDVTVSGGGTDWQLNPRVVGAAELFAAAAQFRILARVSASGGDWEELVSSSNVFDILQAADFAAVRTLLGLVIGTNVQAWDAQLDSLSAASANGVSLVTAADYAAMKALLDLEIGTDVRAQATSLAEAIAIAAHLADEIAAITATGNITPVVGSSGQGYNIVFDPSGGNQTVLDITGKDTGPMCGWWLHVQDSSNRTLSWDTGEFVTFGSMAMNGGSGAFTYGGWQYYPTVGKAGVWKLA